MKLVIYNYWKLISHSELKNLQKLPICKFYLKIHIYWHCELYIIVLQILLLILAKKYSFSFIKKNTIPCEYMLLQLNMFVKIYTGYNLNMHIIKVKFVFIIYYLISYILSLYNYWFFSFHNNWKYRLILYLHFNL